VPGSALVLAPPNSRSLLEVIAAGELASSAGAHPVLDACARLAAGHRLQWDAEDRCRLAGTSTDQVGVAKKRIDQLNATRVANINAIDDWIVQHATPPVAAEVPLHTETVGSIVDRLVIADLRARQAAGADTGPHARRQRDELAGAYDTLLAEVSASRRRLPDWRILKQYAAAS